MDKSRLGSNGRRLTRIERKCLIKLYEDHSTKVDSILHLFEIDRRTLYHHLHKEGIQLRCPGTGNTTNHPTKFERELHNAAVRQLTGGES